MDRGNSSEWHIDPNVFWAMTSFDERAQFLLRYAILAPSTHNTQPWLFKIKEHSIELYLDPHFTLPEADPKGRNAYISMGCMLTNFEIAARYFGVYEKRVLVCDQESHLIAEIFLKEPPLRGFSDPYWESLITAIQKRTNARGIFSPLPIPPHLFAYMANLVSSLSSSVRLHLVKERERIESLAHLTAQGLGYAYHRPSFRSEMARWVHHNFSSRREGIPGYALRMPTLLSLVFPFLVRTFDVGRQLGFLNYKSLSSAPLISVLTAAGDFPTRWLEVGQVAERLMLEWYAQGFKTSIFVAAIEMGEFYKEVQKLLVTAEIPQFLFAVGYMEYEPRHTPRHGVESKIIK